MKHTPGPWHIANGCQIRSAKDQIAKAWMTRNGEGLANARLIAAAPELLEALELLAELADGFSVSGVYFTEQIENLVAVRRAFAAIAKSKGES